MRTTTLPVLSMILFALSGVPAVSQGAPAAPTPEKPGAKKPLHQHHDQHGGQVGMWKDWHLEVVEPAPGEIHVWLTDAAREPVDSTKVTGIAIVTPDGGKPTELPLEKGGRKDGFFSAKLAPLQVQHEIEVRLDGLAEKVFMSFVFPAPGAAPAHHPGGTATQPASQPGSATQPSGATQSTTQPASQPAAQQPRT